ncbi:GNAT family N-acetyltransferase [Aeromicrobium wangtongii]|uniref:GNAT family N-acetyltransferase n=1 Tax=Aeromicrobium wangtongii TaxID=2969247 RepID=A0ABY5M8F4_9ACTN|nr:GNAT family N-acetyltransferase [Aeromicrobium wangtongii]MCD9196913.1 GNAT family N-acetyltransferase [Aeromicrobium wangtongii]UUP14419.1 GNAT family N-acetyltransferase [Aeromicrobium wangtongii]
MIFSSPDPAGDPYLARAVLSLQRASYAVEADLIGDHRLPPLQEDQHQLAAWRGRWVLAWDGVDLVGAVAWSETESHLEIEKLMIGPAAMRRGIGSALLGRVVACASGRRVLVTTGRDNVPAVSLYRKHGFAHEADVRVPPGIWISRLALAGSA